RLDDRLDVIGNASMFRVKALRRGLDDRVARPKIERCWIAHAARIDHTATGHGAVQWPVCISDTNEVGLRVFGMRVYARRRARSQRGCRVDCPGIHSRIANTRESTSCVIRADSARPRRHELSVERPGSYMVRVHTAPTTDARA